MMICLLSLGGIPPMLGFLGKWFVFGAAIDGGMAWLAVAGALNAAISLYYYLRIVVVMYMRDADSEVTLAASWPLNLTLAVTAAVTLLGIAASSSLFEWARASVLSF